MPVPHVSCEVLNYQLVGKESQCSLSCIILITSAGSKEFSTSDTYAFISALSFISKSALVEKPYKRYI